jgi:hypothetical protein
MGIEKSAWTSFPGASQNEICLNSHPALGAFCLLAGACWADLGKDITALKKALPKSKQRKKPKQRKRFQVMSASA